MDIGKVLDNQNALALWIDSHLPREFTVDRRKHLALACFELAIEHHAAICTLGKSSMYGTLYALIRVQFEAYARGLWLLHVASDEQVVSFKKNDEPDIKFGPLLKDVETEIGCVDGPLSNLKTKHWGLFCSFTHTGYQALDRRVSAPHKGMANYSDDEVISALRLTGSFALLAASAFNAVADHEQLVRETMEKLKEYASAQ